MASPDPNPNPTRSHIAVLAFPFGTHAAPLLHLAGALSAVLGSAATFSFLSTARSNRKLFGDRLFEHVKPYDVRDGIPEGHDPPRNPIEAVEIFLKETPDNFKEAIAAAESEVGERFSCVVSDAFLWFAGDFAAERGVPWFPLWTAAPRSLLVHLETDEIRRRSFVAVEQGTISEDQILDFLPGFSAIRVSDLPEGVTTSSDSAFSILLHKMGQTLPEATAVLINSFRGIDPQISDHLETKLRRFLNVRPLDQDSQSRDPHGCLEWLSRHGPASVVYISFGTVAALQPGEAAALAAALEETELPFLWSSGHGDNDDDSNDCIGSRPESGYGKVVPWAPQTEVLRHPAVGAFVTHCGWNSVLEGVLGGGAPMVCRPFFGDQGLNARTVEAVWRIGVGVGAAATAGGGGGCGGVVVTKESVVKALRRVFDDGEDGRGMRERISVMKRLAHESVGRNEDFSDLVELIRKRA